MKRRLFLKTGSVGVGGIIAMPTFIYGCATLQPNLVQGPSMSVSLFQEGSRLFDSSIAELRLTGSGQLASAEAEDVTLAGTSEVDLNDLAEQVANLQAAVPAELNQQFAESSIDMLDAAGQLAESAPEMFPLSKGIQAELSDDFALLKVVKASSLLASAAMATPQPVRKVKAAEKMIASAEVVQEAMNAGAESKLIEGTGSLLAHSEEYVGAAEQFVAKEAFIGGVKTYRNAIVQLAENNLVDGVSNLLTSSDNIALSSGYYADGVANLNAEAGFFGATPISSAEEIIPFTAELVKTAPLFVNAAKGESAELGAAKMVQGSAELMNSAEIDVATLGLGGNVLDVGADQFIAGETVYNGATEYAAEASIYLSAAESLNNRSYTAKAEAEYIHEATEILYPASQTFFSGAQALQKIKLTDGVQNLVPAVSQILTGAKHLQSEAVTAESKIGVQKMIAGATEALSGAIESEINPVEFLQSGAESIELGTNTIMLGAAEFVEGYR